MYHISCMQLCHCAGNLVSRLCHCAHVACTLRGLSRRPKPAFYCRILPQASTALSGKVHTKTGAVWTTDFCGTTVAGQ